VTQTTCQRCDTPTDATLCHPCTRRLTAVLDDLPQWLAELGTTAARQGNTSSPDGGKATKQFEQPIPLHAPAVELLDQAGRGITEWATTIAHARGLTPPPMRRPAVTRTDTRVRILRNRPVRVESHLVELRRAATTPLSDVLAWLTAHADDLRHVEEAAAILTAATALRDACRRMVDNLGRRWAGPCTAKVQPREIEVTIDDQLAVTVELGAKIGEPRECGADLRTRPGAKIITCPDCGATYDPIDRAQWIIAKARDAQAGPEFLAEALTDAGWPLKPATIRQWASRGKLFSYRDDPRGRAMYRVGDVLDLVKTARTKAGLAERERIDA
jgi:hypothetical protein